MKTNLKPNLNATVLIWAQDPLLMNYLERIYLREGYQAMVCKHYLDLKRQLQARANQQLAIVISLSDPLELGIKHCRQLHQLAPMASLLTLTQTQDPASGQAALAAGADDYLFLPIQVSELLARTQAHLRRSATMAEANLRLQSVKQLDFGPLTLLPAQQQASFKDQLLVLSANEFKLLHLLARHANQYLSRAQLHQGLWQTPEAPGSRRLDNFILSLRKKLPPDFNILTSYGQGYCLKMPENSDPV